MLIIMIFYINISVNKIKLYFLLSDLVLLIYLSKMIILGPAILTLQRSLLEMNILRPCSDLQNRNYNTGSNNLSLTFFS